MNPRMDVGKVVYGAFMLPWLERESFARALALPVFLLCSLTLCSHYLKGLAPYPLLVVLFIAYWLVFVWFAVTCHRLVLLDPARIAKRWQLRWSLRETRFLGWLIGLALISLMVIWPLTTILGTVVLNVGNFSGDVRLNPSTELRPGWLRWTLWASYAAALYVFGRLCVVFPATALDRKVNLQWAWRLTRGNGSRLFAVVAVLPSLMSFLLDFAYRDDATTVEAMAITFVGIALLPVEIAAVSLSYRELSTDEPSL